MSHLIKSGKLHFLEAFFIKRRYPGSCGHPGPAHHPLPAPMPADFALKNGLSQITEN